MIYNTNLNMVNEPEVAVEVEPIESEVKSTQKTAKTGKLEGVISHQKFYNDYIQPDQESAEWDKAIKRLLEGNQKSLYAVLASRNATLNTTDSNIYSLIKNFGMKDRNEAVINAQVRFLNSDPNIDFVKITGNNITIAKKFGAVITSMVLSETFGWNNDELGTKKQLKKANIRAIDVAESLTTPSRVITGKVSGLTSKSKFMHNWVETTIDNKSMVIDYSMNAIINKSGYYSFRNAEFINAIESYNLPSDIEAIRPYLESEELTINEYLVHRDAVMEALNESENE